MRAYDTLAREFAERIEYYRSLGVNPFSLATGRAVKFDPVEVLYPALRSIRGDLEGLGLRIAPRRDANVFEARAGDGGHGYKAYGELSVVSVYTLVMLDREIAEEFERRTGISVEELPEIKSKLIKTMAEPNVEVAKAIEGGLPDLGEDFNPRDHIAVTTDVTGLAYTW